MQEKNQQKDDRQIEKCLSMLGLAQKAGRVVSGEFAVEHAVKAYKAYLILVAEDASENTRRNMENMAVYYETPLIFCATKEALGRCIGKEYRSMAAVTEQGFAESLIKKMSAAGLQIRGG